LSISIWTVLVVGIYAKATNNFLVGNSRWVFILYALYVGIHIFFILNIHGSINRSLSRMYNMVKYILENNNEDVTWKELEDNKIKMKPKWELCQIIITVFLILIFHFTSKP